MRIISKALLVLGAGLCLNASVEAQSISVGSASGSPGGATTPALVPVIFTRNNPAPVADFAVRVNYTTLNLDATVAAANGGGCSVNDASGFVTVTPPAGLTDVPSNTYCNITFTIAPGAPAPSVQNLVLAFAPAGGCIDSNVNPVVCALTPGTITIAAGGGGTAPTVAYVPVPTTIINFPMGAAGTAAFNIGVASAGGTAPGSVTVNGCSATAGFTISNSPINLVGTPASQISGSINLACTRGGAVQNGTLTCSETSTPGAAVVRSWPLVCPVAAAGNVPPTLTLNPIAGSTITYIGAGTGGPIVVTPSGGSGAGAAATTTFGACTITGGGAAFPTTNIAQLSFVGASVTPQNLVLPNCVPQAAAVNATLTCPETAGGGAAVNRVFTLTCPAAAVGNVPPTITYLPTAGSTINVASAAATTIQVGCPTDGAACSGSGAGLAATARLESLTATYAGPPFSPTPTMQCLFVNEAGTALPGAVLDFVATQADPGDIRCTCPVAFSPEPFTVSVNERIPASSGTVTATRTFNIVCGAGLICPTLTAAPNAGTVSLVNGGGNGLVTTYTVTGIQPGATQTINCVQSNVTPGSAFTVTTVPNPLVLTSATPSGTVSASCTNTNLVTATSTLTCTPVSSAPGCAVTASTFTLSCPGGTAPPQVQIVPVPAMGEQGRILLASLVLLMGLAVVGFRIRN